MGNKRISMYVHPWDLILEGTEKVLGYLKDSGIDTINIATSYHTGRYLLPHNPRYRIYNAEEGVVYFDYKEDYFKNTRIKPRRSSQFPDHDVLRSLTESGSSFGIQTSSWTVYLHNSAFVEKYPDLAIIDPYGNNDANFLCLNRLDTRNYVADLTRNICDSYDVSSVQMETPFYPTGLQHGNHHELFGSVIDASTSYLSAMCYCRHCREKAGKEGLDLEQSKRIVRKLIDKRIEDNAFFSATALKEDQSSLFNDLEESGLSKLVEFKQKCMVEMFDNVHDVIRENNINAGLEIVCGSTSYFNEGISLAGLPENVSGLDFITYFNDSRKIVEKIRHARSSIRADVKLYPAIRINYPMISEENQLQDTIQLLAHEEMDGLNLYNYGWSPNRILDELTRALRK